MTADARAVANFILDRCDSQGIGVYKTALLKIVYFCHVWSLIELDRPLIKQKFEAWEFGPVLQYLYREFKGGENQQIMARATKLDPISGEQISVEYDFDQRTEEVLTKVVDFYGRMTASQLVDMSHAEGGPWHKVWHHTGKVNPGMKINDEDILQFYSKAVPPHSIQ